MTGATGAIFWIVIAAIAFVVEGLTVQLVGIWFGFGALFAMLVAALGAPFEIQLLVFILTSILVMILIRPAVIKKLRVRKQPTNADMVIGQAGVVLVDIDNIAQTGRVHVNGLDWTARSMYGQPIPAGEKVVILQIDGVKLIVQPIEQPTPESPPSPDDGPSPLEEPPNTQPETEE